MNRNNVGTIRQLGVIFQRDTDLFISDPKKIASTLLFPAVIAVVIVAVSKDSIFANYEGTKSALFTILSAGIYVGMFNSLTSICKERKIIKREYMTNMSLRLLRDRPRLLPGNPGHDAEPDLHAYLLGTDRFSKSRALVRQCLLGLLRYAFFS